jgi:riboflavin synthase
MFTGIISDIGTLRARDGGRFQIACRYAAGDLQDGASIACDGCCLTVVGARDDLSRGAIFAVDVSNETIARTTIESWTPGRRINLERPLVLGAELGGHLVTGHIDGLAKIIERSDDGESVRFVLESPGALARLIAPKGSVALNGVSLTVNLVDGLNFGVNIIPYTLAHSTWGDRQPGDLVNLEVDLLARYVERMMAKENLP